MRRLAAAGAVCVLGAGLVAAPTVAVAEETTFDEAEAEARGRAKIYGYLDAYWEKVASSPAGVDANGDTVLEENPHEFDVPNVNLMVQSSFGNRFRGYLNLKAPGAESVDVRNAWLEASLFGDYLVVRAGKMYRPFGLYNEILDAVPTYIGIEPPEIFDKDHLMLTRTTNLMVRGGISLGEHRVAYAFTTGNDEREADQVPVGADLQYNYGTRLRVGTSFYTSSGNAVPTRAVGDGSPDGGVATWMSTDHYMVYGGYLQLNYAGVILQAEYWESPHDAKRNPDEVLVLAQEAELNERQIARFGFDPANPQAADVTIDADYTVQTYYARIGYSLELAGIGEIVPYAQYDFYRNPETVKQKDFGGDNEAGLSDNGEFIKYTGGVVYRPVDAVALKLDGSNHRQKFNGETVNYPEIRISFSYLWSL